MAQTQYTLQYVIIILPICIISGIVYIRKTRRSSTANNQSNYRYSEQLVKKKLVATNGKNNFLLLMKNLNKLQSVS